MKKIFKLLVLLWMFGVTWMMAQSRSMSELDAIANSVIKSSGARASVPMVMKMTSSQVLDEASSVSGEAFYIYAPADGECEQFVIVSGDKRMPAVLGYSEESNFDANNLPDGLRWFLEKCHADAALLNGHPAMTVSALAQTKSTSVAPLLGGRVWDQGIPFNNLCPEVSAGVRAVTGCTATAMAQIMAHYKHPQKGVGNINYTTSTYCYAVHADMDNASAYDWDNMIESYNGTYSDKQAHAVAQLMFHAGAAITTDYCEISSGAETNSPEKAFITNFGYDDGIRIVRSSDCSSDTWHGLLVDELLDGRPVLVSGFDNTGYGGHAFVFDGLDTEGNFHVNWGWSGLCDGYYNLYNLMPEDTGIGGGFGEYNYNCQAIIGIYPEDGVKEADPTNIVVESTTSANGLGTFDLNTSINLNLKNFINMRYLSFKGYVQLMLTDADGERTIAMFGSPLFINIPSGLPQNSYIESIPLTASLPADIEDGDYRLYIGVRQSGYEQWGRVRTLVTDVPNRYDYYELTVADGKYTLGTASDEGEDDNFEGVPTTINQISNGKAYTVRCARGTLGIQNNRLVATSREDITLEAQKFVFYKYNDKFYLYNLENRMFVALDDNTSEGDRYALLGATPFKVALNSMGNADYPFIIRFGDLWLNVYEGYEPGLVINSWNTVDDGNQFRLEPVEDVSETVQVEIKNAVEESEKYKIVLTTILPLGTEQAWESKYRFTESLNNHTEPALDANGRNWKELDYDDSSWPTLTGPMVGGYSYPVINYEWTGTDNCFELRRKFHLEDKPQGVFTLSIGHDDAVWIYLNGHLVMSEINWNPNLTNYQIPTEAFVQGENILAIYTEQWLGETFLDYTLYNEKLPEVYIDEQGVKYQLAADGSSSVTVIGHGKVYNTDITISDTIMGYSVTGIASGAFSDVTDLTSVTMLLEKPYALPADAFSSAVYQHAQLIVPYGCESVYQNATGWSQFNQVTYYVPDEYTDEQGVIYALNEDGETYMVRGYTENLVTKVVIPETLHGKAVTVIGDGAFSYAQQLEEFIVSESITYIQEWAFTECTNLKKLHIGSGVEKIISGAIPGGLYSNGHNPCHGCSSLGIITVDENNKYFSSYNGMLYDKAKTTLCIIPSTVTSLKESDFPSTLTRLASWCFRNVQVDEVVIPRTVVDYNDLNVPCKSLTLLSHSGGSYGTALCSTVEKIYFHSYYPPECLSNVDFWGGVKDDCVIHVCQGLKQAYMDRFAEIGRQFAVVDDIEPTIAIDVDYSFGYDVKNLGLNAPKLGVGLLLTKEEAKAYAGCQITSVHFCVHPWGDSELSAFITKGVDGERVAYTAMHTSSFDGWRKLVFDTPYIITGEEELFIGMNSSTSTGVNYTNMQVPEGKLWFDWGGLEGSDWQPWSDAEGALAIAYTIEGDNLPANIRMTETTLTADEQGSHCIKGKLESCTIGLVDGCDIAYSINGGEPVTTHLDLQMVAKRHYEFEIPVTAEMGVGKNQVDVWVSKVGDRPDGIESDSHAQFTLIGQSERYERKVVVEEGTGTWCGYCPRGIVGMRTMLQNHPDNFIPIAVHDDNMYSSSYGELNWRFGGFPACTMNRKYDFDPNAADLEKFYQQEVNQAVARIDMEAQWADEAQTKVQIKTVSRFAFDMTEEYRIAYAVTESGVGPYPQANYYSGGEEMGGFEKEPGAVSILHDHVARSISTLNGEPGSVPVQPKGMTDYEYSYTLSLPDNIDNKENIQLVVLLINQETGEIVNADNVRFSGISAYDPTAHIEPVDVDRLVDVYSLQGILLKSQIRRTELEHVLPQGIYIVDGEKMIVR